LYVVGATALLEFYSIYSARFTKYRHCSEHKQMIGKIAYVKNFNISQNKMEICHKDDNFNKQCKNTK